MLLESVTASLCCCMQADGIENPKVQSVYFPDLPLHKAAFANDGSQVHLHLIYVGVFNLFVNA